MQYNQVILSFSLLMLIFSSHCLSKEYKREEIEQISKNYVEQNYVTKSEGKLNVSVAQLDPRIIIKPCEIPLKANIPEKSTGRNVNVKISCEDSTPWKMYLTAKVSITYPVLVATKTIPKGSRLTEDNVALKFLPEHKIRGEKLNDFEPFNGAKVKRRIGKGKAINNKSLCIVCKGDSVTITAESKNFSIKTQGKALSSGNIGEQIRVENMRSGKIITPQVIAINQVVIHL